MHRVPRVPARPALVTPIRVAVVALVVVAALAGCLRDARDGVGDAALVALGLVPTWEAPILVATGADAESSVQVGPDGLVLACTHGGFWQPSPVYLSRDHGTTWTELDIGPNPLVSGDCDVLFMPDGAWAVVYDTIASATVAVSRDEGATWTLNFLSALPIAVDRPWLAADGDTLVMSYANVMAAEPAIGMVARSTDHATTWSHELYALFASVDRLNHVHGDILVSTDGIRIPVGRADLLGLPGGADGTSLEVYTDSGAMPWTRTHVADTELTFILPSLAEDGDGTLYTVVPRPSAGEGVDLHVAWSTDRGATWQESAAVAVEQGIRGVIGPWIDGRPGGATIAWRSVDGDVTTFRAVAVALATDVDGSGASGAGADAGGDAGAHAHDADAMASAVLVAGPVQDLFSSDHRPGQIYEFLMVDHAPDGTAFVAFVHDDGSGCDPAPNAAETRGSQCQWLVRSA